MILENLISKLKTNAVISLILGLLSLTWIILDYFIIKDLITQYEIKLSIYILLLALSGIAFFVFILFVFITIYYIFRSSIKYNSDQKKSTKKENPTDNITIDKQ